MRPSSSGPPPSFAEVSESRLFGSLHEKLLLTYFYSFNYLPSECMLRRAAGVGVSARWVLRDVLRPAVASPVNQFGASLAVFHTSDADYSSSPFLAEAYVLAVGAPGDCDSAAALGAGSVYLYLGPHNFTSATTNDIVSSDQWTLMGKVRANFIMSMLWLFLFFTILLFSNRCLPMTAVRTTPTAAASA